MAEADPPQPNMSAAGTAALALIRSFDRDEVTKLRHLVAAHPTVAGLNEQKLDDFVLAVNELITNAVRHGGGRGWLRLWRAGDRVYCEVSDVGAGIGGEHLGSRGRPDPDSAGGWGLWLAHELSDEMVVRTGPAGTVVRISTTADQPIDR